jgi:hypothetical protein
LSSTLRLVAQGKYQAHFIVTGYCSRPKSSKKETGLKNGGDDCLSTDGYNFTLQKKTGTSTVIATLWEKIYVAPPLLKLNQD